MKPLIVLLGSFAVTAFGCRIFSHEWNWIFAGNLAMCVMLLLTASGHILFTKGMEMMIPPIIPFRKFLVYFTGVIELALGAGLLFPSVRAFCGIALVVFFVLLLPANVYAAWKRLDIERASYDGPGLEYLWFRVPLQLLFIGWAVFFSALA